MWEIDFIDVDMGNTIDIVLWSGDYDSAVEYAEMMCKSWEMYSIMPADK